MQKWEVSLIDIPGSNPTRHLALDNPAPNPGLARRLPPALAFRYHALPVAEDNGRITVTMVDPDDAAAREAVATALGTTPCVVRGAPATIDALLAETWPEEDRRALRLLICCRPAGPTADEISAYGQAMGVLLGAHVSYLKMAEGRHPMLDTLTDEVDRVGYHLVILGEPDQLLAESLSSDLMDRSVVDAVPTSLVIARQPRQPLRRRLLVIWGEETDDEAVDWVVRLARPSGAAVTVLAMASPALTMYHAMARIEQGLSALLTQDTTLGLQTRRVARRLANWEIEGTLRLRQGAPDWQIRLEMAEGHHDLIVVAAEAYDGLPGGVISPLLRWADRPVLIAKPITI